MTETFFIRPTKTVLQKIIYQQDGFIKEYKEQTGTTPKNVKEIRERIPGDETATSLFTEFGKNLKVLAVYVKKHAAETVVMGGNIINAWKLFMRKTKKVLSNYSINVLLKKAKVGEEAALLGAAVMLLKNFINSFKEVAYFLLLIYDDRI